MWESRAFLFLKRVASDKVSSIDIEIVYGNGITVSTLSDIENFYIL